MAALRDAILTAILLVLLVGSITGVIIGIGLAVRAEATLGFFRRVNRWGLTWLDVKAREERPVVAHAGLGLAQRRVAGSVFVAGGGFAAFALAISARIPGAFIAKAWGTLSLVLIEAVRWLLVVGCVFAVLVGILLLFFPDAWTRFEAAANRWKSTHGFFSSADTMHTPLDRWVESSPQAAGWLIAILSTVSVVAFGALLYIRFLKV